MHKVTTTEQGFNRQLASHLRPGASIDDAKAVWGSRWQTPSQKDEGYVGLRDKLGFHVRIDREKRIGYVGFSGNFPPKYLVEGLQLGMTLHAALASRPELALLRKQDPEDVKRNVVRYRETLADGCELEATMLGGKLIGISIERPGSQYPKANEFVPAPDGKYRMPAGIAGAPFSDPNVKLYVVGMLMKDGVIDLGSAEELAMHVRGRFVDFTKVGYKPLKDVYQFLVKYPINSAELASLNELWFDRGAEIVPYSWPYYDGETGEFDVFSLAGIEHCPNLRIVSIATQARVDLAPLTQLCQLEIIEICENADVTNAAVLLEIGSLKTVRVRGRADVDAKLRSALEARGVSVAA